MANVNFELRPREITSEQCWIYVDGELVEKCACADKDARLAAHGLVQKTYTARQAYRQEQAQRGRNNGTGFGGRYGGRR